MNYMQKARDDKWGGKLEPSYDWQAHTHRALIQCHGAERAQRIMDGKDAATNRDLAKWNNLGAGR